MAWAAAALSPLAWLRGRAAVLDLEVAGVQPRRLFQIFGGRLHSIVAQIQAGENKVGVKGSD